MTGIMQVMLGGSFSGGIANFIGVLSGASSQYANGTAVDSSANMYMVGSSNLPGTDYFQITKYNSTGAIQWQNRLGASAQTSVGTSVAVSSTGNVYAFGYSDAYDGGLDFQLAKYDSSGTLQWQVLFGQASQSDYGNGIAMDSSENLYVCGTSGSNDTMGIVKYNSSGTVQWQRRLYASGGQIVRGNGVAVDSSANVYVVGNSFVSGSAKMQIAKYNSSGTLQWQVSVGASTTTGNSIAVDSSGNVFTVGYSNNTGVDTAQLLKYNTSGVLQWQRTLGSSRASYAFGICTDATGNVYFCGYTNTQFNSNDALIAKYNSSGSIQWQRTLSTSASDEFLSIVVSGDNLFVCGDTAKTGTVDFLFACLPIDGTKTGTYTVGGNSYTYAASSLTDSAGGLSSSTSSLTDAATTRTAATSTLTNTATTLTSSVTVI